MLEGRPRHRNKVDASLALGREEYTERLLYDFYELREHYPFSEMVSLGSKGAETSFRVVAASRRLISKLNGVESDFTGTYSRELRVVVPADYIFKGCNVYGAKWLDCGMVRHRDRHFYSHLYRDYGHLLCVGTPDSVSEMRNVLLENVRTADNLLTGYEEIMREETHSLNVIAYSHSEKGREEYKHNCGRYRSKRG